MIKARVGLTMKVRVGLKVRIRISTSRDLVFK